jgi:hypothetical protein
MFHRYTNNGGTLRLTVIVKTPTTAKNGIKSKTAFAYRQAVLFVRQVFRA